MSGIKNMENHLIPKLFAFFILFGIVGNFICILVFTQKRLRVQKFNRYLLFQAITDVTILFIILPIHLDKILGSKDIILIYPNLVVIFKYIWSSLDIFNACLILIISIDRLYAVLRPTKIKSFVTYRFPCQVALIGLFFCLAIQLVLYSTKFMKKAQSEDGEADGNAYSSIFKCLNLAFKITILTLITLTLISFFINLILSCYVWKIFRKPRLRTSIDEQQNGPICAQSNVAIASSRNRPSSAGVKKYYLLVITLISLIDLPLHCMVFAKLFLNADIEKRQWVATHLFYVFNHSINFVVYYMFHKEFRAYILNTRSAKSKNKTTPNKSNKSSSLSRRKQLNTRSTI